MPSLLRMRTRASLPQELPEEGFCMSDSVTVIFQSPEYCVHVNVVMTRAVRKKRGDSKENVEQSERMKTLCCKSYIWYYYGAS